jgi:hypothetical protein
MDIARIFSLDHSLERAQDRSQSRSEETFSQAANILVRLDSHERPVEVAFNHGGLQAHNLHGFFSTHSQQFAIGKNCVTQNVLNRRPLARSG